MAAAQTPTAAPTLAGRIKTRLLRRSADRRRAEAAAAGAGAATGVGAGSADPLATEDQEEFVRLMAEQQLHPDLDDCAELSELLLTGEDEPRPRDPRTAGGSGGERAVKELQAQLMALAIENEALRAQAASGERAEAELVRDLRRQLAAEREMRRRVEETAERPAGALSRAVNRLRRRRPPPAAGAPAVAPPPEGVDLESLDSSAVDSSSDEADGGAPVADRRLGLLGRMRAWAAGRLLDLMEDLQPQPPSPTAQPAAAAEGPPLSARRLKTNATRFGRCARPLMRCLRGFRGVVRWRSPSYTLMVAVTYYFALRYDLLLSLILLLCIARLGLNYLIHRRHWTLEFNFLEDYETQEEEETHDRERTVGTQVNFVVQVARKVQNLTGTLSDNMEKFKNLVTWRSPRHTQTLFNSLIAAFAVSMLLPASTCFYYAGIYLGVKLLIIDSVFARFPRLRRRYDGFARMWRSLPTDQQLGCMGSSRDVAKYILPYSEDGGSGGVPEGSAPADASPMASDDEQFCQVFALPNMERPLQRWRGGKRCAIICRDGERTLSLPSSLKHGKLFLTRSFLCFERSKDRGKMKKRNLVIPLSMIRWVRKAKTFAWFPGSGMSIEVDIVGVEKPITFSAIIGRDEAFDSLMEAGLKANLGWAGGDLQNGQSQQPADPQLVQSVSQALLSDSDMED